MFGLSILYQQSMNFWVVFGGCCFGTFHLGIHLAIFRWEALCGQCSGWHADLVCLGSMANLKMAKIIPVLQVPKQCAHITITNFLTLQQCLCIRTQYWTIIPRKPLDLYILCTTHNKVQRMLTFHQWHEYQFWIADSALMFIDLETKYYV